MSTQVHGSVHCGELRHYLRNVLVGDSSVRVESEPLRWWWLYCAVDGCPSVSAAATSAAVLDTWAQEAGWGRGDGHRYWCAACLAQR